MMNSKEYPDCPECDGITYPTFDHEKGKFYLKCHSCRYDSRREEYERI
jgi:DNA-directed RNA polymerase subunit M/transcription elongation factor TFIIS